MIRKTARTGRALQQFSDWRVAEKCTKNQHAELAKALEERVSRTLFVNGETGYRSPAIQADFDHRQQLIESNGVIERARSIDDYRLRWAIFYCDGPEAERQLKRIARPSWLPRWMFSRRRDDARQFAQAVLDDYDIIRACDVIKDRDFEHQRS